MKNTIKIATQSQTIQALTSKMLEHKRYAYINFSRSALIAMADSSEKKTSLEFSKDINKSFNIKHPDYMKAVPSAFVNSNDPENELGGSDVDDKQLYYNSTTLENYFNNNGQVFTSFIDFYVRHNPYVIVTFHDRKIISKTLGTPVDIVYVPYNDYHGKLDYICETLSNFSGKVDTVVLDCPILSAALANRIWDNLDFSIIDFGKVISFARNNHIKRVAQSEKVK